ncbi:MAG: hypothetical protein ABW196_07355 [Solirubrobacterales bacterium]
MLPQPSHGSDRGCDLPSTEGDDARAQRAVLDLVLAEHPAQLTICELGREINQGEDFAATDAVERAIRDLVGVGVLRCQGVAVVPTRAAMHCGRLWL